MKLFEKLFHLVCHPISILVAKYDEAATKIKEPKKMEVPKPTIRERAEILAGTKKVAPKPKKKGTNVVAVVDGVEMPLWELIEMQKTKKAARSIKQSDVEDQMEKIMKLLKDR